MEKLIKLIFFIFLASNVAGQTTASKISFTYDAAGNRVKRMVVEVIVDENPHRIGVTTKRDAEMDSLITLYPNPTSDVLKIKLDNFKANSPIKITMLDLSGRIILTKTYTYPETSIDLTGYRAGTYILQLKRENLENTWRIIKNSGIN